MALWKKGKKLIFKQCSISLFKVFYTLHYTEHTLHFLLPPSYTSSYFSLVRVDLKTAVMVCFLKNENIFVPMVTGNMVRGLDEDETSFLDEVSRQQCLVEKQRRDEEKQELLEYRISFIVFVSIKHFN